MSVVDFTRNSRPKRPEMRRPVESVEPRGLHRRSMLLRRLQSQLRWGKSLRVLLHGLKTALGDRRTATASLVTCEVIHSASVPASTQLPRPC